MRGNVESVRGVVLRVGEFPREATKNHTHEDDRYTPDVRQPRVVVLLGDNFGSEVRIRSDDSIRLCRLLSGVLEYDGGTKIYELDRVVARHDAVVEFEISMRESHRVKVVDTVDDLLEDAVDLGASHLARHDDREQVEFGVLHDFVVVTVIRDNVESFDNVRVMKS
jgi:hypothetical protein